MQAVKTLIRLGECTGLSESLLGAQVILFVLLCCGSNEFLASCSSYRQAQATVLQGVSKLHKLGIKTKRPEDYFAEMAKSDDHMKKVSRINFRL